jgi:hypothetical protein
MYTRVIGTSAFERTVQIVTFVKLISKLNHFSIKYRFDWEIQSNLYFICIVL